MEWTNDGIRVGNDGMEYIRCSGCCQVCLVRCPRPLPLTLPQPELLFVLVLRSHTAQDAHFPCWMILVSWVTLRLWSKYSWEAWIPMTDIKKKQVPMILTMWTILLMNAEFNTNNKKLGRDMMRNAESHEALPQELDGLPGSSSYNHHCSLIQMQAPGAKIKIKLLKP